MTNIESNEPNPTSGEYRYSNTNIANISAKDLDEYLNELQATSNTEELTAFLKQAQEFYDRMHAQGGVGGEYEWNYVPYIIIETKKALGLEPKMD
jgi:ABC-type transport system substrate-binding protein